MPAGSNMQNCNNYNNYSNSKPFLATNKINELRAGREGEGRGEWKRTVTAAPLTQFKWLANVSMAFFDKCAKRRRFYAKRK